jgi:hypothetical protein
VDVAKAAQPSGGTETFVGPVCIELVRNALQWLLGLSAHGDSFKEEVGMAMLRANLLPALLSIRAAPLEPSPPGSTHAATADAASAAPFSELDDLLLPLLLIPPLKKSVHRETLRHYAALCGVAQPRVADSAARAAQGVARAAWPPAAVEQPKPFGRQSTFLETFTVQLFPTPSLAPAADDTEAVATLLQVLGTVLQSSLQSGGRVLTPGPPKQRPAYSDDESDDEPESDDDDLCRRGHFSCMGRGAVGS